MARATATNRASVSNRATIGTGARSAMLFEDGDTMIYEDGDAMVFEDSGGSSRVSVSNRQTV